MPATGPVLTYDTQPPSITAVSIPNAAMKVGDVVTATLTVSGATGENLTLVSGSVGGFALSNLQKVSDTSYTASFTVSEGGVDVAAGSAIGVSVQLQDGAGNASNTYNLSLIHI